MSLTRRLNIVPDTDEEKFMQTALKIAFATTDMETVNQHFGSAKSFAVYAVTMEEAHMLEAAEFGVLNQDGNEDKLSVKLDLLDGCAAVYCQAVGGSAINQLIARGIQPVKDTLQFGKHLKTEGRALAAGRRRPISHWRPAAS